MSIKIFISYYIYSRMLSFVFNQLKNQSSLTMKMFNSFSNQSYIDRDSAILAYETIKMIR